MLNIQEFESLFKGCMPRINWDRAKAEQWGVTPHVVDSKLLLGTWKIVITKGGVLGDGGEKIQLTEVPGNMDLFNARWRQEVFELAAEMESEQQKVALMMPAISNTIMDGNHRSVACMLGAFDFSILLLRLLPNGSAMWGEEDYE